MSGGRRYPFIGFAFIFAVTFSLTANGSDAVYPVRSVLAAYSTYGTIPVPVLTEEEMAVLQAGEPVVKTAVESGEGGVSKFGVVGLRVIDSPRLLVWLTAMGVASEPDVRLTRAMLTEPTIGTYVRYQHVNLPWPLRDRHWVIHCEKDTDIAHASDGRFWEHRWQLVEDGEALLPAAINDGRISGLTAKQMSKSVYLPANQGAWSAASVGHDKTLVIASFDGSLGGMFPDAMVRRFAKIHLREGLNLIAELSRRAHLEYADSRVIYDGFGRPISREDVQRAASATLTAGRRQRPMMAEQGTESL
mgnify:CR=1 FL=1